MSGCQESITRHLKRQKTQLEEIEQASEPDIAERMELPAWEFKITMMNVLKALMDKVDRNRWAIEAQRWKSLGKNQKEMLKIKKH